MQSPLLLKHNMILINQIKRAVPTDHSLIPKNKSYRQQEHAYVAQVRAAGYHNYMDFAMPMPNRDIKD